MFLRLPLATEYCFESDCHGHDQLAKQKKTWSLSDWRCRNPKGPCKISKLKTGLWTLQVLVAFLHLLYGEVSVKILTSFSRTRTHINILASGAVTSGTELGWLRVFSHPELIQWGNLWCILQIHAGTTSRNFAPDLESHVNWCISVLFLWPLCVWCHHSPCDTQLWSSCYTSVSTLGHGFLKIKGNNCLIWFGVSGPRALLASWLHFSEVLLRK